MEYETSLPVGGGTVGQMLQDFAQFSSIHA